MIQAEGAAPPFAAHTDAPALTIATYDHRDGEQWLVAFGAESTAWADDRRAIERMLGRVVPELAIRETFHHDWITDRFTQGAWAGMKPGQVGRGYGRLDQVFGRVTFATSDIAHGWRDTLDGAIESGIRAARVVHEMI